MLGLRQNLRILTPERHALFLLSNRLCRHQHESFKGKKKSHVGGGDKSLLPVPPPKNKDNITKRRGKKNFRRPKLVSRMLQRLCGGPAACREASGERRARTASRSSRAARAAANRCRRAGRAAPWPRSAPPAQPPPARRVAQAAALGRV